MEAVKERLDVAVIRFHIGLFMYRNWEKHPKQANAKLAHDTHRKISLMPPFH